jgi:hypothetical protein
MRCPRCRTPLKLLITVEVPKAMTLPTKQIIHAKPKSQIHEFMERLEPKREHKGKPKPKHQQTYTKEPVEPIKPPKLVTVQNATIRLFWCERCGVFVKTIK